MDGGPLLREASADRGLRYAADDGSPRPDDGEAAEAGLLARLLDDHGRSRSRDDARRVCELPPESRPRAPTAREYASPPARCRSAELGRDDGRDDVEGR